MAEGIQQRRSPKNAQLQSDGVLTVAQGREMVRQRDEEQVNKARKVIEAVEMKARSMRKKCFEDATLRLVNGGHLRDNREQKSVIPSVERGGCSDSSWNGQKSGRYNVLAVMVSSTTLGWCWFRVSIISAKLLTPDIPRPGSV
ncbi:hypothetical protein HIM_12641 [Hirsutella minnesotensis 3608]|uniref:Uncharacterized protein n=1 Tax=Hirsutella minnesotensis 3608 TaxID=1043627 RepID=A0A0F7ZHT5_9HYPO|nr:hypothetical protein HIM_12641 [Hirsutella minnesotensis 3608]